jgi:hypothetical protein
LFAPIYVRTKEKRHPLWIPLVFVGADGAGWENPPEEGTDIALSAKDPRRGC